jgi:4-amino-4-deoxy-L-arabinose transferase-like glycosyltransferase
MLTWLGMLRDGAIPLLGPPTSIGDFHHGALYYYLLAPAAAVGGGLVPVTVVAGIALVGTAAVAATWWLARSIGGQVAGFVAGLLLAVSATAIEGSTFIWNPNLIAFSSAVALGCAWRARHGGGPGWWLGAATAATVTMQCHVLGVILLPMVVGFWLAELRSRQAGPERRPVLQAGVAGVIIVVVSYLPLVVHELTSGFSETAAAIDYVRSGGVTSDLDPLTRLLVVGVRTIAWPLVGLFTDTLGLAIAATALVVASAIARSRRALPPERSGARWLGMGLAWSILALTVGAGSLTTVVLALPVDHYHAFVDPIVIVLAALGIAAAYRRNVLGRAAAVIVTGFLVAWNLATAPPAVSPDGGYPAALRAADRVLAAVGDHPVAVLGLPDFKPTDALLYPLTMRGASLTGTPASTLPGDAWIVVMCDDRFHEAIGSHCGGPAEDAVVIGGTLVDRFPAHPSRWVSVYAPAPVVAAGG